MHKLHTDTVPVNWFDLLVIITLMLGLRAGRKRGMSEELIVMLQWIAIILAGAFLYRPLGDFLAQTSPVSHLFCYVAIYIAVAIIIKIGFSMVKTALGGKLVGSDVFGQAEYYLGMIAGAIRYACILIAALALMNAPYYTAQEIGAARAYQNDVYGSNFFPEFSTVQTEIFRESMVGSLVKKQADVLLIASTKPEHIGVKRRKDDLP